MNDERSSLDNAENSSVASLPDNDVELMPKLDQTNLPKMTIGGVNIYSESSIQHIVHDLEAQYKRGYIKPDDMPKKVSMIRQFPKSEEESSEQRARKQIQAETSRVSRDKYKFMRARLEADNEVLMNLLSDHIKRLTNLEHYANEVLVNSGQPPIKWQNVWIDDACPDPYSEAQDEAMDESAIQFDDHSMENTDETPSDNENLTIYEIDEAGRHSGQEDA